MRGREGEWAKEAWEGGGGIRGREGGGGGLLAVVQWSREGGWGCSGALPGCVMGECEDPDEWDVKLL